MTTPSTPPFKPLPLFCKWGWHKWSVWSKARPGEMFLLTPFGSQTMTRFETDIQDRSCLKCFITQKRTVR